MSQHFPPAKRLGLLVHGGLIALLAVISSIAFITLSRADVGPTFLVSLLVALLAFIPIPFLGYSAYALWNADYRLDRDSLAMNWGLRVEAIPLSDIEWVRPARDLMHPLNLPWFRLPGAILGIRRHPDVGVVEFLASQSKNLLLVATAKRTFVISPQDAATFVQTFARATELGSLTPTEAKSFYPTFVIMEAWDSGLVRYLWLSGLFLNIGLFAWVSLTIPTVPHIALGLQLGRGTLQPVPSTQLIILPVVSLLLVISGWLAGLYFFRWEKERALAFIVWASSTLASLLFLVAMLFIITTPV